MSWLKNMMEAEPPESMNPIATVVIGNIEPDMHDTAKEAVRKALKRAGFRTVDAGKSVPIDVFIQKIQENNASILALSINTVPAKNKLEQLVCALQDAGLANRVKIIMGGAAVKREDADAVGALFGKNKEEAPEIAMRALSIVAASAPLSYCGACGNPNPNGYRFCGKCGKPLQEQQTRVY
jgi:methanogenic corrinoid protein MtbC1